MPCGTKSHFVVSINVVTHYVDADYKFGVFMGFITTGFYDKGD